MRIGFLTAHDARDRRTWSGTPSFMAEALARQAGEVVYLGPLAPGIAKPLRIAGRLAARYTNRRFADRHYLPLSRAYADLLVPLVAQARLDVIFAPAASQLLACAELDVPVIYSSDATFAAMTDYYADFSNLYGFSARHGNIIEALAIKRSQLVVYPSQWAADSAVRDYGADPEKLLILPYGANLSSVPAREAVLRRRLDGGRCRLLFVGVDWQRKGGDIAVAALRELKAMGFAANLTVCGCQPPEHVRSDDITVHPFVDKNRPGGIAALTRLYLDHDVMIFPTRQEAYGIVAAEASAHGLPVIASAVGGVPGVVYEGRNGHLLPAEADGAAYAHRIAALLRDPERYRRLSVSSRDTYETDLNWDNWAQRIAAAMRDLTRRATSPEAALTHA